MRLTGFHSNGTKGGADIPRRPEAVEKAFGFFDSLQ